MTTIRINFQGVAVHLVGVIPGVPCRVVFPDATASYLYEGHVLDRHFTSIIWESADVKGEEPWFRQHFSVGDPVTGQKFQLDPSMAGLYYLPKWVPNLQLSSEVIYAGRTALYFDIFYGVLSAHKMKHGALFTSLVVDVEDEQPPWLVRVPFQYASVDFEPNPSTPEQWTLPSNEISIVNMGKGCHDSKLDFALNFLVTRGGIPKDLKDLPGQNGPTPPPTNVQLAPYPPTAVPSRVLDVLSQACSASWFPGKP
jgi:hypothetical protein